MVPADLGTPEFFCEVVPQNLFFLVPTWHSGDYTGFVLSAAQLVACVLEHLALDLVEDMV